MQKDQGWDIRCLYSRQLETGQEVSWRLKSHRGDKQKRSEYLIMQVRKNNERGRRTKLKKILILCRWGQAPERRKQYRTKRAPGWQKAGLLRRWERNSAKYAIKSQGMDTRRTKDLHTLYAFYIIYFLSAKQQRQKLHEGVKVKQY